MSDSFDPYHKWLGIHPKDQPPTYYRLLGLEPFESDPDVIESSADRAMGHLRSFQTGKHGPLSQQLLNEVAAAKRSLLDPARKAAYDEALRQRHTPPVSTPPSVSESPVSPKAVVPVAMPVYARQVKAAMPVVQPADDPTPTSRPLWQEPVLIVAAAGGSAIGLAVLGALILASLHTSALEGTSAEVAAAPAVQNASWTEPSHGSTRLEMQEPDAVVAETEASAPNGDVASLEPQITAEPATNPAAFDSQPPQPQPAKIEQTEEATGDVPRIKYEVTGQPINLLKHIVPERDAVHGKWYFEQEVLVAPDRLHWARLQIPIAVPDEYVLTVEIAQPQGADILNLGLVAGGSQFIYCPKAWNKGGLFLLDGKEWHVNETSYQVPRVFRPGPNLIMCIVHRKGVLAQINHRTVVDWEGDFRRLTLQELWQMPSSKTLFLGTGGPRCDFVKVELQAIQTPP